MKHFLTFISFIAHSLIWIINFHTREFVIYSYTICCFLWTNNFLAFVNVVFIIFTVLIVTYMYT